MDYLGLLRRAVEAMRADDDPRWHSVADLLAGGPSAYAGLVAATGDAAAAVRYPDLTRATSVARAYLGED